MYQQNSSDISIFIGELDLSYDFFIYTHGNVDNINETKLNEWAQYARSLCAYEIICVEVIPQDQAFDFVELKIWMKDQVLPLRIKQYVTWGNKFEEIVGCRNTLYHYNTL